MTLPCCAEPDCHGGAWGRKLGWSGNGIELQGAWYCSPQCFEAAARRHFQRSAVSVRNNPRLQHRVPLGLLMLSRGQLDNRQLRTALKQQSDGGGKLGGCLEKLGFVTEQQITAALGMQWACPVVPPMAAAELDCARMVPLALLQEFRMLPIHYSKATRLMHVAFSDGVDYTALYAIEQILGCRTEACVVSSSVMARVLEALGHERRPGEMRYEGWRDAGEMARIASSCALKLGACEVRMVTCGEHVWVRLRSEHELVDVLFRRCPLRQAEAPVA